MKIVKWTGGLKILVEYGRMSTGRVVPMRVDHANEFVERGLAEYFNDAEVKGSKKRKRKSNNEGSIK